MLRLAAAILAAFLFACGTLHHAPLTFNSYRACSMEMIGGRLLFDAGTVVGEEVYPNGTRVYHFLSDRHPNDGKHVQRVLRIRRMCEAAGPGRWDGERPGGLSRPQGSNP